MFGTLESRQLFSMTFADTSYVAEPTTGIVVDATVESKKTKTTTTTKVTVSDLSVVKVLDQSSPN